MLSTVRKAATLVALLLAALAAGWTVGPATALAAHPGPARAGTTAPAARPLVVIGIPGLTWDDIDTRTPRLAALAAQGGTADLVVRTVDETTCPVDGWLTLGAGARARAGSCAGPALPRTAPPPKPTRGQPQPPAPPATIDGWPTYVTATHDAMSGAHLGSLGTALSTKGSCVAAVGPGAALAAAGEHGAVPVWKGPFTPEAVEAAIDQCGVTVVDIGAVHAGTGRAGEVTALDTRLGQVLDAAGPEADVLAAALADDGSPARLRPVVVHAPGFDGHRMTSPSTRQPGLVLLTDLAPTITHLRGIQPDRVWTGDAVEPGPQMPAADRLAADRDLDLVGRLVHPLVGPFVIGWIVLQLLLYGLTWLAWRFALLSGPGARRVGAGIATTAAAWPAATFLARLVPWWRTGVPVLALAGVTAGISVVMAAVAWAGPWRRHPLGPAAVVSALTIAVLVGDLATGSRMVISTLIGEHPTVGGRFYGLGNAASGILAAATLLLMTALIERGDEARHTRWSAVLALLVGLGVVAVIGAPQLGADFGGPAALLPAVAYLALRGLGLRLDAGRVLVLGLLTVGVLMAVCLLDWLRPEEQRTHLGRFTESLITGQGGDVIGRKLIQNWTIFTSTPLTLLLPFVVVTLAYLVWRPRRVPGRPFLHTFEALPVLRVGLLSIFLMLFLAMLLNDSGATVPAPVALLVVPLVIGVMLLTPLAWGGWGTTADAEPGGATRA